MSELQALLFDVDGTLADTERDGHRVAFNKAFENAGLDWFWTVNDYGELLRVTGGKERIRYFIAEHDPAIPEDFDADEMIGKIHADKTTIYNQLLAEGTIPLRPGIKRILNEARDKGLRLGVATTTTPTNVVTLLENTLGEDSIGWFDVIAAGDIVDNKKPAPDIYQYAMEKMALSPDEVIAFEDSENGVRSAVQAGITAIIVATNNYTADHDFEGATTVLDGYGDMEDEEPATLISGAKIYNDYLDIGAICRVYSSAHPKVEESDQDDETQEPVQKI